MKKGLSLVLSLILVAAMFTACGNTQANEQPTATTPPTVTTAPTSAEPTATTAPLEKTDISVAVLKGPTAIGMVKLMKENANGTAANNYTFTVAGAADEITASLTKGTIQIAAVPCNLASTLYNKTEGKIRVIGINTLGVIYIVETGNSINSVSDLKGKTIYSTGQGTTPEYTLRYLLESAGINPDTDVTIEFKSEATEVAAILSQSTDAIAMLPQPYVTTVMSKNENIRIALDVTKEWEALSTDDSTVVTGVLVANTEFLANNEAAVKAFLDEYALSAAYATSDVEGAAALVEEFGIFNAAVAKVAIPMCNIVFISGDEMKLKIEKYLNVLYNNNAASVGGSMPDDTFYYGITK